MTQNLLGDAGRADRAGRGVTVAVRASRLFLAVVLLACLAASVVAESAGSGRTLEACAPDRSLSAIAGVITASTIRACLTTPEEALTATSSKGVTWDVAGPNVPTGGIATFTATTLSATGCTVSAWTTTTETLGAGTGAASRATVTMTSNECVAFAQMVVTAGAVPITLGTFVLPINIVARCGVTIQCLDTVTDDATGWAVTNPEFCGKVSTCHVDMTGTVTVSDDANGWTITNPELCGKVSVCHVDLTGNVIVHQDQACGATNATRCHVDLGTGLVSGGGNSTGNGTAVVVNQTDETLAYWVPVLLAIAAIIAGIHWGNPFLLTVGLMGVVRFSNMEATSSFPFGVTGWVLLASLALVIPGLLRIGANFLRKRGFMSSDNGGR